MAILNELNEKTEKVIHLLVTTLCDRNCKYCCNKQYDLNEVPQVTVDELKKAEIICLTGGEPFSYSNPNEIAKKLKREYPNIKKVYVYTNAYELNTYLSSFCCGKLTNIDGLNISIKSPLDAAVMDHIVKNAVLHENRIYVFDDLYHDEPEGFTIIHRKWQKNFVPADDSIFRRI